MKDIDKRIEQLKNGLMNDNSKEAERNVGEAIIALVAIFLKDFRTAVTSLEGIAEDLAVIANKMEK